MKKRLLPLLLAPLPALACPGLVVDQAWIREAPPGASVMVGYARVQNPGAAPVQIDGASSPDFGAAQIHRTVIEDGLSKMLRDQTPTVAPGETLRFEPGGLHLMLFRPAAALRDGDHARIRLLCGETATDVDFAVRSSAP